jgi:sugar phosphate isomerase/epimerase
VSARQGGPPAAGGEGAGRGAPREVTRDVTRRDFLRTGGVALGGVLAVACGGRAGSGERADSLAQAPADSGAGAAPAATGRAIGLQLYTVRTLMERDVEGTLAKLAEIGYRELEFAGYFGRDPKQLRATLDRLRVTAPSTHRSLDDLRKNLAGELAAAQALGCQYVVCPFIPEQQRTLADYRRIAGEFNRWGKACRERDLRFAYHNHDFEFKQTDGQIPYDVLLAETDPQTVEMELDLYWITKAGHDPLAYFDRHRGRFPLWHVKDGRGPQGAQEIVEVGEGDIDFRRIFAQAQQAGLTHFFVEQDNAVDAADPLAKARTSFDNLRKVVG